MKSSDSEFKPKISFIDVVGLGVGASVGVSIFSVMAPVAQIAGSGMMLALLIAAIPMVFFAIVYSYMSSIYPRSGASYDWPTTFIHPYVGFIVAWMRILGSTGAIVVLALVMVNYISQMIELPVLPSMICIIVIFGIINLIGTQLASRLESILSIMKVLAFLAYAYVGWSAVQYINFQPLTGLGWGSIFASLPLLIGLYMGIETATEMGEEIRNGRNVIGKGIAISISVSAAVYFSVSAVVLGVLGVDALSNSDAPILLAGSHFLGEYNTVIVVFAAVTSISTSLNAMMMVFSRFVYAMGRDGVLPHQFGLIHKKWNTPHFAIIGVMICAIIGTMLGTNLIFLFLAVNLPTMLKYLCNCICAYKIANSYPELHNQAQFKFSKLKISVISVIGVIMAVIIILAGLSADKYAYLILLLWALLGTLYWKSMRLRKSFIKMQ